MKIHFKKQAADIQIICRPQRSLETIPLKKLFLGSLNWTGKIIFLAIIFHDFLFVEFFVDLFYDFSPFKLMIVISLLISVISYMNLLLVFC